jgi:timeless protein
LKLARVWKYSDFHRLLQLLRDRLLSENKAQMVEWLQKALLECCFIKLMINKPKEDQTPFPSMEPISLHCICELIESVLIFRSHSTIFSKIVNKQSIPLVPFNDDQNKILVYQPFVLLLHKLGFHLPADANKLFIRIPEFWTADILFTIAEKLGPISRSN